MGLAGSPGALHWGPGLGIEGGCELGNGMHRIEAAPKRKPSAAGPKPRLQTGVPGSQVGFSLLEVLVAFAILALSLGVLLDTLLPRHVHRTAVSGSYSRAAALARLGWPKVGVTMPLEEGRAPPGTDDGMAGARASSNSTPANSFPLHGPRDPLPRDGDGHLGERGAQRQLSLASLRLGDALQDAGLGAGGAGGNGCPGPAPSPRSQPRPPGLVRDEHGRPPVPAGSPCPGGFTLIELIIALALIALITLLLFSGLRLGARAWDGVDALSERHAELRTAPAPFSIRPCGSRGI